MYIDVLNLNKIQDTNIIYQVNQKKIYMFGNKVHIVQCISYSIYISYSTYHEVDILIWCNKKYVADIQNQNVYLSVKG